MYVHGYRVSRKKGSFSKLRYIAYSNCLVIGFDWPPNDSPVLDTGKGKILETKFLKNIQYVYDSLMVLSYFYFNNPSHVRLISKEIKLKRQVSKFSTIHHHT